MNMTVLDRKPDRGAASHLGFIDCDVHPQVKGPNDFDPFLSKRWLEHKQTIGGRSRQGLAKLPMYPRMSPGSGMRMDSWPKSGGLPGSDLPMMQEQLLDLFDVAYGLLAPLVGGAGGERNVEFGSAMATAVNEWQIAAMVRSRPEASGRDPGQYRAHRSRDRGNRETRRRPPLRPGEHPAARAGAAGPPPLLADPGGLRGERVPGLAASGRDERPCLDRRWLAVLLPRGTSVLRADDADFGDQPGL